MSALRRVRAGKFTVDMAHTLDEIRSDPEGCALPLDVIAREETP